jgi:hypothetical protein
MKNAIKIVGLTLVLVTGFSCASNLKSETRMPQQVGGELGKFSKKISFSPIESKYLINTFLDLNNDKFTTFAAAGKLDIDLESVACTKSVPDDSSSNHRGEGCMITYKETEAMSMQVPIPKDAASEVRYILSNSGKVKEEKDKLEMLKGKYMQEKNVQIINLKCHAVRSGDNKFDNIDYEDYYHCEAYSK